MEMSNYAYVIIFFIKSFLLNSYIFYCFNKILNIKITSKKNIIIFFLYNLLITTVYSYLEFNVNSILYTIIICVLLAAFLGKVTNNKLGFSLVITVISYAISNIALLFSTMLNYILHTFLYKENYYISSASVLLIQYVLLYLFFKIKRFRKGFLLLNDKLNNDSTDLVISFISISVLLIGAFMGSLYNVNKASVYNIFYIFLVLGITMFIMIQRTLTMHYKQTQLLKTMEEYKNEIDEKNKQIEILNKEKFNTSKIRHEFYHRQKALELLVKENMKQKDISDDNINKNILNIIESLTEEYSEECEKIKELAELKKTGIIEIDSMFKYMQNECAKNNIEFKLRIIGSIYPLINNIISKAKLETLIGDHIKDAINAINNDNVTNKEILVILGKKDKAYELAIYDTGVEFKIETLLKLGKEAVTTCANKGGSGIGFLTTFETLKATKASLIITENKPTEERYYTKCVTIRFDGKKQYKIISYRAEEISMDNECKQILISGIDENR